MSDLIDRQDAIDAINVKNVNKGIISALQSIIEELPSAQPEIIRCKDCKYASPNTVYGCVLGRFSVHDMNVRMYSEDFCSRAERRTDE